MITKSIEKIYTWFFPIAAILFVLFASMSLLKIPSWDAFFRAYELKFNGASNEMFSLLSSYVNNGIATVLKGDDTIPVIGAIIGLWNIVVDIISFALTFVINALNGIVTMFEMLTTALLVIGEFLYQAPNPSNAPIPWDSFSQPFGYPSAY